MTLETFRNVKNASRILPHLEEKQIADVLNAVAPKALRAKQSHLLTGKEV